MGYIISDEAQDLLRDLKTFCDKEIVEQAKKYDRTGEWPESIYHHAAEQGYTSLRVPADLGGPGLQSQDIAALMEQVAWADAGVATTIAASDLAAYPVLAAGCNEQKKYICDILLNGGFGAFCLTEPGAGSDVGSGITSAVRNGDFYILNGRKCFITNGGIAQFYCVTAYMKDNSGNKNMSVFLIDRDTPGLSFGHEEDKMGIRLSNTTEVILEDVRVPVCNVLGEEGTGFALTMKTLDQARIWMGVLAVGLAQRAMDEAIGYARKREQFGRPVLDFQTMQFKVADMAIKIEASRQLNAYALERMDRGLPITREASMSKCAASDTAMACTTEAVQMFGGYGYSREYPVEKLMRDAKIFQIFEGTNEIQRVIVARDILKST